MLVVADAYLTDPDGRVLLVQPPFHPDWTLPGGDVEQGETPAGACARELREELGLAVSPGVALVLDWLPPHERRPAPAIYFVFDCGTLRDPRIAPDPAEVRSSAFVALADAPGLVGEATLRRLHAAERARAEGRTAYLSGHPRPA
jgi:8-oxo-dGTP diphosphatase